MIPTLSYGPTQYGRSRGVESSPSRLDNSTSRLKLTGSDGCLSLIVRPSFFSSLTTVRVIGALEPVQLDPCPSAYVRGRLLERPALSRCAFSGSQTLGLQKHADFPGHLSLGADALARGGIGALKANDGATVGIIPELSFNVNWASRGPIRDPSV